MNKRATAHVVENMSKVCYQSIKSIIIIDRTQGMRPVKSTSKALLALALTLVSATALANGAVTERKAGGLVFKKSDTIGIATFLKEQAATQAQRDEVERQRAAAAATMKAVWDGASGTIAAASAVGSSATAAARPACWERTRTTRTVLSDSSAARSAAMITFGEFGSTTTSSAGTPWMPASRS